MGRNYVSYMEKSKKPAEDVLSKDDKRLVFLRDEFYGGSWKEMLNDFKAQLNKKPFVFKLAHNIEADLRRIERLMMYETKNHVNLSDYIRSGGRP